MAFHLGRSALHRIPATFSQGDHLPPACPGPHATGLPGAVSRLRVPALGSSQDATIFCIRQKAFVSFMIFV